MCPENLRNSDSVFHCLAPRIYDLVDKDKFYYYNGVKLWDKSLYYESDCKKLLEGRYNESLKHQTSGQHIAGLEKEIEEITQEEDWIKLQIDRVYELWA